MSIASRKEMNVRKYAEFGKCAGEQDSQTKHKEDLLLALKLLSKILLISPKYFAIALSIPEQATYYLCREDRKHLDKPLEEFIAKHKGGVCRQFNHCYTIEP
jgi:hypothetical protein